MSCEWFNKLLRTKSKTINILTVTIERQCDGDSDLETDSQEGIYPFDTTNIVPTLLTNPYPLENTVTKMHLILLKIFLVTFSK